MAETVTCACALLARADVQPDFAVDAGRIEEALQSVRARLGEHRTLVAMDGDPSITRTATLHHARQAMAARARAVQASQAPTPRRPSNATAATGVR